MGWFSRLIKALSKAKKPTQTIPIVETPRSTVVVVRVYERPKANDNKLPGVVVTTITEANPGGVTAITDGAGNTAMAMTNPGDYDFTPTLAGYTGASVHLTLKVGQESAEVEVEMDPVVAAWTPKVLSGVVSLSGRAYCDSVGIRPLIGATAFAAPWLYRNDRDRLKRNYEFLSKHEVDFSRILCEVGGGSWSDRIIDPAWPNYVEVLVGTAMLAWDFGLRTQFCLFGGGQATSEADQVSGFANMLIALRQVPNTIQLVEGQNESNGPSNTLIRAMIAQVRDELGCPTAITGSPESSLPMLYAGSKATMGLLHTDRAFGDYGHRSDRQFWGYAELADMPDARQNNEPVGFKSSVRSEMDYRHHAAEALVTWISGGAAYVWHTGSGVYFRDYDTTYYGHRFANLFDEPDAAASLDLINAVRKALPADVMNWTRANNHWGNGLPTPPFRFDQTQLGDDRTASLGLVRAYTAQQGHDSGKFATVAIGVKGTLQTTALRPVTATVRSLADFNTVNPWEGRLTGNEETFLIQGE